MRKYLQTRIHYEKYVEVMLQMQFTTVCSICYLDEKLSLAASSNSVAMVVDECAKKLRVCLENWVVSRLILSTVVGKVTVRSCEKDSLRFLNIRGCDFGL